MTSPLLALPMKPHSCEARSSPVLQGHDVGGAIFLHLQGMSPGDNKQSCSMMVYVNSSLHSFYLFVEVMLDLGTSQLPFNRCQCIAIAGPRLHEGSRPTCSKHTMLFTIDRVINPTLMSFMHGTPTSCLCPAIRGYPQQC